jgi:lipopolysaccharide assembly outer membrane protein LptD (OstA)
MIALPRQLCILIPLSAVVALAALADVHGSLADSQKQASEPDYKVVNVKADVLRRNWGPGKATLLSGSVMITQGDTVLKSDKLRYYEEAQVANSPGPISITDTDISLTGDSGSADLKLRKGIVQGNVKLIAKKSQGPSAAKSFTDLSQPVTVTCDTLEYLYKQKTATATGRLKLVQRDRVITADKAVYQVKDEIVTLTGNVKGSDVKGQTISSGGKVTVSLKSGDEWMEVEQASGSFKVTSEEETAPGAHTRR